MKKTISLNTQIYKQNDYSKESINKEYKELMKKYFPDGLDGDMVLDCDFKNPVFKDVENIKEA